jgi:hypothetical protein
MEANRYQGWKGWRQGQGYKTLRGLFSAWRLGFLVSATAAGETAYFAFVTFACGTASLFPVACFEAGVALSLAVLCGFVLRGSHVAIVGVMAVYTIQTVFIAAWGVGGGRVLPAAAAGRVCRCHGCVLYGSSGTTVRKFDSDASCCALISWRFSRPRQTSSHGSQGSSV